MYIVTYAQCGQLFFFPFPEENENITRFLDETKRMRNRFHTGPLLFFSSVRRHVDIFVIISYRCRVEFFFCFQFADAEVSSTKFQRRINIFEPFPPFPLDFFDVCAASQKIQFRNEKINCHSWRREKGWMTGYVCFFGGVMSALVTYSHHPRTTTTFILII